MKHGVVQRVREPVSRSYRAQGEQLATACVAPESSIIKFPPVSG
jgi:hypothetical protein